MEEHAVWLSDASHHLRGDFVERVAFGVESKAGQYFLSIEAMVPSCHPRRAKGLIVHD